MALCDAAELAKRSPGGRLPTPLVAVLAEAANICRWRQLARPLQPLRLARDPAAHTAALLVPRRTRVGQTGMRKLRGASNGRGAARPSPLRNAQSLCA
jgi:hypothetical protein